MNINGLIRKFLKGYVEPVGGRLMGKLWAPCSVSVLAHGDRGFVVLESGGKVSLPGGLIKGGETLRGAARRELKEETGCNAEIGDLLDIRYEGIAPGIHFYFEGKVIGGELEGSWEGDPKFVEKEKIGDLDWELHHSHVEEYLFSDEP